MAADPCIRVTPEELKTIPIVCGRLTRDVGVAGAAV